MNNYKETRPWGTFENLLDSKSCKVKQIIVNPGQRLSYQYHHKRNEVWVIIEGEATITLDGVDILFKKNQIVDIPVETKHRVHNKGEKPLKFIEVQTGTYFGEDDIVRLEDDYSRL